MVKTVGAFSAGFSDVFLSVDIDIDLEVYYLWYQYLKENKDYKLYCDEIRKNKTSTYDKSKYKFDEVYKYWGDIHSRSWEDIQSNIHLHYDFSSKILNEDKGSFTISLESENLAQFINQSSTIKQFPLECENKPFILLDHIFLAIPINSSMDDLIKQLKKVIKKNQEEQNKILPFPKPTKGLIHSNINIIKRYLKVYQLREIKKLSWDEVLAEVDPEGEIHDTNYYFDIWRKERDAAKKIIENVGMNLFPGKYRTR